MPTNPKVIRLTMAQALLKYLQVHTATGFAKASRRLAYEYPFHFFSERVWRIERRLPSRRRIQEAVGLLKKARRPVIIAGGGVHINVTSNSVIPAWATTFQPASGCE